MKKGPRCKVNLTDTWEFNCLYSDGSLLRVPDGGFIPDHQLSLDLPQGKELRFRSDIASGRQDYLMGIFLRETASLSLFRLSLRDFEKGQAMKRFLIYPLGFDAVIKLPWLLFDIFYSVLYYFLPKGFCPQCQCKYIRFHGERAHDPQACSYNQEYQMIEEEVFSGKVFIDLDKVRDLSQRKVRLGEPSALYDLVHRKVGMEKALDVVAILVSIFIYIALLIMIAMPILNNVYHFDVT